MAAEYNFRRDITLKPREAGTRSPEVLKRILSRIYPEETVAELMKELCDEEEKESTSHNGNAHKN